MKIGTVALVVGYQGKSPLLLDALSDDQEIVALENALRQGHTDPLSAVYTRREEQAHEDEQFGDYVEELVSQPFIKPDIQKHGMQWLKSKAKIEEYQRSECEATKVIANYAYKVFMENPDRTDFILAGPKAQVRIRVFTVPSYPAQAAAA